MRFQFIGLCVCHKLWNLRMKTNAKYFIQRSYAITIYGHYLVNMGLKHGRVVQSESTEDWILNNANLRQIEVHYNEKIIPLSTHLKIIRHFCWFLLIILIWKRGSVIYGSRMTTVYYVDIVWFIFNFRY